MSSENSVVNLRLPSGSATIRILPFAIFILLLALEPALAKGLQSFIDPRWSYALRAVAAAGLLVIFWRHYSELSAARFPGMAALAVAAATGIAVLGVWLLLDFGPFTLGKAPAGFDPSGADGRIDWALASMRLAGAALVVPLIEELFWRSFLMRWLDRSDFLALDPVSVSLRAIAISSLVFGFEHGQWAAGIIAGVAYAFLYQRFRNLWVAVVAHGITNTGLGFWVLAFDAWHYW